jgi:hypothetical protein
MGRTGPGRIRPKRPSSRPKPKPVERPPPRINPLPLSLSDLSAPLFFSPNRSEARVLATLPRRTAAHLPQATSGSHGRLARPPAAPRGENPLGPCSPPDRRRVRFPRPVHSWHPPPSIDCWPMRSRAVSFAAYMRLCFPFGLVGLRLFVGPRGRF